MNNMTEVIKHLRAAQPPIQAMGDALERHAARDEPEPVDYECYWDDFGCRNMTVLVRQHPLSTNFDVLLGDGVPQPTSYKPVYLQPPTQQPKQISRLDELVGIAEFIGDASLLECKHIINELIDRTSTITGCATELENAACALTRSIEIDGDVDASDSLRAYTEGRDEA